MVVVRHPKKALVVLLSLAVLLFLFLLLDQNRLLYHDPAAAADHLLDDHGLYFHSGSYDLEMMMMIVHWPICRLSFSTRDVAAAAAAAVVDALFVVAVLFVVAALFVVAVAVAVVAAALFVVAVSVAQLPYEVSNTFFLLQAVDQQYQTTIENSCLKKIKIRRKKDDNNK
jgi:hypothetical protein